MKFFASCILVVLSAASTARADDPDLSVVPQGTGWQCATWFAPDHADQSLGMCARTVKGCEHLREERKKNSPSNTITECAPQPNASVFTFHDKMRDNWQFAATPETRQCELFHKAMSANPDHDHISDCMTIGAIAPPEKVDRGKPTAIIQYAGYGWSCYAPLDSDSLKVTRCVRAGVDQHRSVRTGGALCTADDQCKVQKRAFVFFEFDDAVWHHWYALAAATAKDCAALRARLLDDPRVKAGKIDSVTACKEVGDVDSETIPFTAKSVAPGAKWYCPRGNAGLQCDRDENACRSRSNGDCDEVAQAYVFARREFAAPDQIGSRAYRTAKACEAGRKSDMWDDTFRSTCTKVGVTRRALDHALLSSTGWFCYKQTPSFCERTVEDCVSNAVSANVADDVARSRCKATDKAFAMQVGDRIVGFPTADACKKAMDKDPAASECEQAP